MALWWKEPVSHAGTDGKEMPRKVTAMIMVVMRCCKGGYYTLTTIVERCDDSIKYVDLVLYDVQARTLRRKLDVAHHAFVVFDDGCVGFIVQTGDSSRDEEISYYIIILTVVL
ncbi:unnamed protein product, partial [Ixodes pacificus]